MTDENERLMDYVSSIAALNRVVRQLSQSLMVDKKMALKVRHHFQNEKKKRIEANRPVVADDTY